jgi:CDP-diacylglycerol--serine O-phosphatidyltransferase
MLKRNLPDALTLANLACGVIGIRLCLEGQPVQATWMILLSGLFDFFDGMAARALKVNNPHGKDLDSLADVVSFGVLPGFLAASLIGADADVWAGKLWMMGSETESGLRQLSFIALIVPSVLSAYRLAKFNHDTRQTENFIGLATPAHALFWVGLVQGIDSGVWWLVASPMVILVLIVVFSLLLLSPLPMFSFKMKSMGWKGNEMRYSFLALSLPALIWLGVPALALIMVLYLLFSVFGLLKKSEA